MTTPAVPGWFAHLKGQLALDTKQMVRHRFVHVVLGLTLLFGGLLRLAPDELAHPDLVFVADRAHPVDDAAASQYADPAVLRQALEEDEEAIGMILGDGEAEVILRGGEGPKVRALALAQAELTWLRARGLTLPAAHDVATLGPPRRPAPFGGSLIPLVLALDTAVFGFLFGAVLVLQEKAFGTVRLYRVSPGGTSAFVASKLLVNLGLAAAAVLVLVGVARPAGLLSAPLWGLALLAAAATTLLGIGLAAFFRNLAGFFYPMAGVSLVLSLPMAVYLVPSLHAPLLGWLPTHDLMFGAREALFPVGHDGVVASSLGTLLAWAAGLAVFAHLAIGRRVMREPLQGGG